MLPEDAGTGTLMRSKGNPFQSVPHDKKATVFHKGFLKRKAHADIDGKRSECVERVDGRGHNSGSVVSVVN